MRVVGATRIASAVPLLQPLALSAATRRACRGRGKLLDEARAAAAAASGAPAEQLERIQRVQLRTLLMIAVLAGAFYFLLPQLAQADDAWDAFTNADLKWVPVMLVLSALTYVGAAFGIMGSVAQHLRFLPTLLAQVASSFINRVTPASVGGMVLNARFLEKSGVDAASSIAAVGLSSVAGLAVHLVMTVAFFIWSGSELGKAFSLPSTSTLLLVLAILSSAIGLLLATRWGRRKLLQPLVKGVRSAAGNLARVSRSPLKLALLFGGSLVITLANVFCLYVAVVALGGDDGVAKVGAVYLAGRALASAAPTPGNLGAIEAALVAGLTGIDVEAGIAVSAVLTFRVATYWLPIVPGWLCWQLVQRWRYV
jgi:undecaprenyl-diphosphatase